MVSSRVSEALLLALRIYCLFGCFRGSLASSTHSYRACCDVSEALTLGGSRLAFRHIARLRLTESIATEAAFAHCPSHVNYFGHTSIGRSNSKVNRRGVSRLCACSSTIRVRPQGACAIYWTLAKIGFVFTAYLSNAVVSGKRPIKIKDLATLKRFVAVIGRSVPCIRVTDKQTDQVP